MKRERQWDMFDVAIGACGLDDYLNQRYQESDLQSKFWVEKEDRVDELRPPAPGSKQQVLIPVQGPGVSPRQPEPSQPSPSLQTPPAEASPLPARPPWEAPATPAQEPVRPVTIATSSPLSAPLPTPPALLPTAPSTPPPLPTASSSPPVPAAPEAEQSTPRPVDMAELLARFHQATQDYQERTKDALSEPSGPEDDAS